MNMQCVFMGVCACVCLPADLSELQPTNTSPCCVGKCICVYVCVCVMDFVRACVRASCLCIDLVLR